MNKTFTFTVLKRKKTKKKSSYDQNIFTRSNIQSRESQ